MDLLLSIIILVASIFGFLLRGKTNGPGKTVPEARGSWPIIGHLHLLAGSQVPHKVFGSMADKFGPIFSLKFGVHRVLIVSNAEMAKECLTTNDRVFASRPKAMATELLGYNYANFAFTQYGPFWREIRKIVVLQLLSQRRLQSLAHIRVSEMKLSIIDMHTTCLTSRGSSETVDLDMKQWFGNLIANMVVRMIFGSRVSGGEYNEDRFKKAIERFAELMGAFAPSDAIPALRWLDLGGYQKTMKKTAKELDKEMDGWLEVHKKKMNSTWEVVDDEVFMAALLSRFSSEPKQDLYGFSVDEIVKATCVEMYAAATETTSLTLTWALALLVTNPVVLKTAHQELESTVGTERNVEESDLKNLVYLHAIIKETMRLYPAAALSIPHESTEDCVVGGYNVPNGTRLFVNISKIQRDPKTWTDPFEFQPERFLSSKKEIDVKGQHFELIPFGSGRRMCVGISLALEVIMLVLANILHGFDFRNPSNEQIDMTESPGLTNPKATPLELLVAPRLSPHLYEILG